MKRAFLLLLIALPLFGCAAMKIPQSHKVMADNLTDHGLLIGTIAGGSGRLSYLNEPKSMRHRGYNLQFGTRFQKGARLLKPDYYNRTFIVALPPGDYELTKLSDDSGFFTVSIKFTIQQGNITSLGGLFFYAFRGDPEDPSRKPGLYVLHIDNEKTIEKVLINARPDLYGALQDRTIHKIERKFLSEKQLNDLRMELAVSQVRQTNREESRPVANQAILVNGNLGMAGWVHTDSRGEPKSYQPLPLDTLDNVHHCATSGKRFACILDDSWTEDWNYSRRIVIGEDKQISGLEIPENLKPSAVHLFGEGGIAVGNYGFRLIVRTDDGDWKFSRTPGDQRENEYSRYIFVEDNGDIEVSGTGNKSLKIMVLNVQMTDGTVMRKVDMEVRVAAGNGYERIYPVSNRSPTAGVPEHAFNGVVALAVIDILNDEKIIAYIND